MSVAELVPRWPSLPDPEGDVLNGASLRGRLYRLRSRQDVSLEANEIIAARGFKDNHEVFLRPNLSRDMPSPQLLADMIPAAHRLARAVRKKEKVVVFGDYDVDGASSSALIAKWFKGLGVDASMYIPDRLTEGYGPSVKAVERALANGADLMICVDCGTASAEVLEDAQADVVVIDHHKQQGDLPQVVAVVNPHRNDCTSGLGMLCATALAFLVVTAATRKLYDDGDLPENAPPLRSLLDLVALATVADVVPLVGPSRLFVSKGLEVMAKSPSVGISALMSVSGVQEVSAGKIGFALGPRVNAGGRVGEGSLSEDGALGARLLATEDEIEAASLAARLDAMNKERQEVEKTCLEEAIAMGDEQAATGVSIITVFGKGWHPGVVGIVAGRLRERFDMPALVGALDGGVIKGSGRSIAGFDLGAVIVEAKKRGLLETGGGHAMACGFGCRADAWADFEKYARRRAEWKPEPLTIDCMVGADKVSMEGIESLNLLEPVGQGNPSVKAAISGMTVKSVQQLRGGHVKINLAHAYGMIEGLWWRARDEGYEETLLGMTGVSVIAVGAPKVDEWQGRRKISLELSDIIPVS